jgi:PAS domain-containing protein
MEILTSFISAVLFSLVERNDKEMWVLFDSFKRSQRIYKRIADQIPVPAFITDSLGYINYFNLHAHDICGFVKKKGKMNFLELVFEDQKKTMEETIKRAIKEPIGSTEVLLLSEKPKEQNELEAFKSLSAIIPVDKGIPTLHN